MFGVGEGEAVEQRQTATQGRDQTEGKRCDQVLQTNLGPVFHEDRRYRKEEVELHEDFSGSCHRKLRKPGDLDRLQRHP